MSCQYLAQYESEACSLAKLNSASLQVSPGSPTTKSVWTSWRGSRRSRSTRSPRRTSFSKSRQAELEPPARLFVRHESRRVIVWLYRFFFRARFSVWTSNARPRHLESYCIVEVYDWKISCCSSCLFLFRKGQMKLHMLVGWDHNIPSLPGFEQLLSFWSWCWKIFRDWDETILNIPTFSEECFNLWSGESAFCDEIWLFWPLSLVGFLF